MVDEERYKAIMDVIPKSEREKGFLYYSDDDIYEIGHDYGGEIVTVENPDLDEATKEELRKILSEL